MKATADMTHNEAIGKQVRGQLGGLSFMFLLGMLVNLIGLPSEATGSAKTATSISLGLHGLIGLGLIAGGIAVLLKARSSIFVKHAWLGLLAVLFTFLAGLLTMATESNVWSYIMAAGFILSFWVYGALLVKIRAAN